MDKRDEIKRLFNAGFRENPRWTNWYFNNVYNDSEAMIAYSSSQPVSCLMLNRYTLKLGEGNIGMGYISCATTLRQARGQGHMGRLINDAMMEAAFRGDAIASLIPASQRLYDYYSRYGFATIFYADEHRYTSLHQFNHHNGFTVAEPTYETFNRLELSRRSTVIHSPQDYINICSDISLDGGYALAVSDTSSPGNDAMLFATATKEVATVKDILASSPQAYESMLEEFRNRIGNRMIIIWSAPDEQPLMLHPRGMGRIVNVQRLLETIIAGAPETEQTIRIHDNIISDNNAVFIIHNGYVERASSTMRRLTLDVTIDTLAKIIFNSSRVGEVFPMPAYRPYMALMLD